MLVPSSEKKLVDTFGRVHRSLRLSVTDVCNIRCKYCMPADGVQFLDSSKILTPVEIESAVTAFMRLGIRSVRITGGEPLTRRDLPEIIRRISSIDGLDNLAMTTNGMLLPSKIDELVEAGLRKVNISLDTLREDVFKRISRRAGIDKVLAGIVASAENPRLEVKLNALMISGVNAQHAVELVEYASQLGLEMRFIEFMPLDAEKGWSEGLMVSGTQLREELAKTLGEPELLDQVDPARPAKVYLFPNGQRVGFIDSVSQPFCGACDRLRLTAEGALRNCLFGHQEWDVKSALAQFQSDPRLGLRQFAAVVHECLQAKAATHGIADSGFQQPSRAMYQIGG